jgi:transposase
MDMTDEQWQIVETILPRDRVRPDRRGRPWSDRRTVLNGALWILRTGAPWQDLPPRYGPHPDGASALPELGALWGHRTRAPGPGRTLAGSRGVGSEGMFRGRDVCSGQKRGRWVGKTKRGKGTKIMGIADGQGLPLALRAESASPAEVKLVETTLEERIVPDVPERLIGDKAYDSDRLDQQLMQNFGVERIAPNRQNRRVPAQDGRPLRRYVRRWKVERLFAWLFNFRRLVVRYEYHAENFQGFLHLAAAVILLRHL